MPDAPKINPDFDNLQEAIGLSGIDVKEKAPLIADAVEADFNEINTQVDKITRTALDELSREVLLTTIDNNAKKLLTELSSKYKNKIEELKKAEANGTVNSEVPQAETPQKPEDEYIEKAKGTINEMTQPIIEKHPWTKEFLDADTIIQWILSVIANPKLGPFSAKAAELLQKEEVKFIQKSTETIITEAGYAYNGGAVTKEQAKALHFSWKNWQKEKTGEKKDLTENAGKPYKDYLLSLIQKNNIESGGDVNINNLISADQQKEMAAGFDKESADLKTKVKSDDIAEKNSLSDLLKFTNDPTNTILEGGTGMPTIGTDQITASLLPKGKTKEKLSPEEGQNLTNSVNLFLEGFCTGIVKEAIAKKLEVEYDQLEIEQGKITLKNMGLEKTYIVTKQAGNTWEIEKQTEPPSSPEKSEISEEDIVDEIKNRNSIKKEEIEEANKEKLIQKLKLEQWRENIKVEDEALLVYISTDTKRGKHVKISESGKTGQALVKFFKDASTEIDSDDVEFSKIADHIKKKFEEKEEK